MPFYDEFDLSTVDVLLISQYVSVHLLCDSAPVLSWEGLGASLQSVDEPQRISCSASCISVSMEYHLHSPLRFR